MHPSSTQEHAPEFVIPLRLFGDGAESYRALASKV